MGISFYRDYFPGQMTMRASLAQVFLDSGESFIIRGEPFEWNEKKDGKEPHLKKDQAKKLKNQVTKLYSKYKTASLGWVVLHKTSNFTVEEIEEFNQAIERVEFKDFITIFGHSDFRFYRQGTSPEGIYPVLWGTLISSNSDHFLFTSGYIPCYRSFPGVKVPSPLQIRPFQLQTSIEKIAQEIMAFTRLDWNNAKFCTLHPVTISIARKVGNNLAESRARKLDDLDPRYFYYM